MRFGLPLFTLTLALLALCFVIVVLAQEPGPARKRYLPTGSEATITGKVHFVGQVPKPMRIEMDADPVCQKLVRKAFTENAVVHEGKLANVFVYIRSNDALNAYSFAEPTAAAILGHKDCRYVPHALAVRVGQAILISNDDPTIHNTHPAPRDNEEWNQSQAPGSQPLMRSFKLPEVFIPFKDNFHPWEKAYVGVFSHPFFAISDENGYYQIKGLPPGHYTVVAWHERFGEKTMDITVSPNELRTVDFIFEPLFRAPKLSSPGQGH
jgi:hypothetical protein